MAFKSNPTGGTDGAALLKDLGSSDRDGRPNIVVLKNSQSKTIPTILIIPTIPTWAKSPPTRSAPGRSSPPSTVLGTENNVSVSAGPQTTAGEQRVQKPRTLRRVGSTRFGKGTSPGRKMGRLTRREANNGVVVLIRASGPSGPGGPSAPPTNKVPAPCAMQDRGLPGCTGAPAAKPQQASSRAQHADPGTNLGPLLNAVAGTSDRWEQPTPAIATGADKKSFIFAPTDMVPTASPSNSGIGADTSGLSSPPTEGSRAGDGKPGLSAESPVGGAESCQSAPQLTGTVTATAAACRAQPATAYTAGAARGARTLIASGQAVPDVANAADRAGADTAIQAPEAPRSAWSHQSAAGGSGRLRRGGAAPTADQWFHADRFSVESAIGNGAFSNVFIGYDRRARQPVAIKCIDKVPNFASSDRSEFVISSDVRHKHIIRCLGRYVNASMRQNLVFELANQGDLFDELRSSDFQMPFPERKRYLLQTATAIAYLHSRSIVHFDVKLENILLHNGLVKICDFGLSGIQGTVRRGKPHGTASYMPPEYLAIATAETEYVVHRAADEWAFGIVIFAVAFADLPWEMADSRNDDYAEFKAWGRSVGLLEPFVHLGAGIRKALVSLLHADPAERMPMSEVVVLINETDELVIEEFQENARECDQLPG